MRHTDAMRKANIRRRFEWCRLQKGHIRGPIVISGRGTNLTWAASLCSEGIIDEIMKPKVVLLFTPRGQRWGWELQGYHEKGKAFRLCLHRGYKKVHVKRFSQCDIEKPLCWGRGYEIDGLSSTLLFPHTSKRAQDILRHS